MLHLLKVEHLNTLYVLPVWINYIWITIQVLSTNYGDEESYHHLLALLNNGFNRLLSHEAIEDHYIIHPLLPRLPSTVTVTLQNDVHSNNRLAQLHTKVKNQLGTTTVSHNERLHFGKHLQEELLDLKLISHMDEEEEVRTINLVIVF